MTIAGGVVVTSGEGQMTGTRDHLKETKGGTIVIGSVSETEGIEMIEVIEVVIVVIEGIGKERIKDMVTGQIARGEMTDVRGTTIAETAEATKRNLLMSSEAIDKKTEVEEETRGNEGPGHPRAAGTMAHLKTTEHPRKDVQ